MAKQGVVAVAAHQAVVALATHHDGVQLALAARVGGGVAHGDGVVAAAGGVAKAQLGLGPGGVIGHTAKGGRAGGQGRAVPLVFEIGLYRLALVSAEHAVEHQQFADIALAEFVELGAVVAVPAAAQHQSAWAGGGPVGCGQQGAIAVERAAS